MSIYVPADKLPEITFIATRDGDGLHFVEGSLTYDESRRAYHGLVDGTWTPANGYREIEPRETWVPTHAVTRLMGKY
ncbi:hypothetical protein [Nonomuraea lactucae]|uniref:hypothetical protein n=1 Tax=Nonomuraea lactucae TaxID=2249762 RepID=UPI000DE4A70B|nr:hypothetical protein [Nonomuraea lactucae]